MMNMIIKYSRIFRKQPPKMSSPGGRLREVAACESLPHIKSKFSLIGICNCRDLRQLLNVLFNKSQFRERNPLLLIDKFPSLKSLQ